MWLILILCGVVIPVALVAIYALEQRANSRRVERGEAPKRHYDVTDYPPPVHVIDWTRSSFPFGKKK